MSFGREFSNGLKAYSKAHKVIFQYKLTNYLWIPGLVTLAYCILFFWLASHFAGRISSEASDYPGWLSWMGSVTHWFLKSIYWVGVLFAFWASLKYMIQVLLSPLLSNLSVAVEKKVLGQEPPELSWKETLQDIGRSLTLAIRNFFTEFFPCLVISFVPGVGQVGVFLISSFYYGFGYMDYVLERKRFTVAQSVKFARAHRGLAMGLGSVVNLLMMIPILGWLIGPTYATVAATLETLDLLGNRGPEQYFGK